MTHRLKTLFVLIALGALVAVSCQKPSSSTQFNSSFESTSCLRPACEEMSVDRGDVTVSVTSAGSLRYRNVADLSFDSSSRVASVTVIEGSTVEAGQILATLEPSSLQLVVLEARVSLISAEESLQEVLDPPTSAGLLRAEAEITVARDAVENAQEALRLAQTGPTELALAQAEAGVSAAVLSVLEAEEELTLLKSEPTAVALAEAHALVAIRKFQLLAAEKSLSDLQNDLVVKHQENQLALARAHLKDVQTRLAEMKRGPDPVLVRGDRLDLEIARLEFLVAELNLVRLRGQAQPEAIEERLLQTRITLRGLRVSIAEEELKLTKAGPIESELAAAEVTVSAAVISVGEAEQALEVPKAELATAAFAEAQATVEAGRLALLSAEDLLSELKRGVDPVRLQDQRNRLALARINLEDTRDHLAKLKSGPDPVLVLERHRELSNATIALLLAQQSLARLKRGPDELEVELRRAQVRVAQAAVHVAEQGIENAVMVAPFDGVVRAVNVALGKQVEEETVAIQVVETKVLEMVARMNQIDVQQVKVGQEANITIDELGNTTVQGRVATILPIYGENLDEVSYEVWISGEELQSADLLPGMTAVAEIVVERQSDVLVIPVRALSLDYQQPTVDVVSGGNISPVPVITGLSNGRSVEVTQGLQQGDVIRVRYSNVGSLAEQP